MQITLFGQTDKRPVVYSLLNILQHLGDCLYVTNDRKAMRLMQDGPAEMGELGNIAIAVTDSTADEMWGDIGWSPADYEYVVLDNLYDDNTDMIIYIMGAGEEEEDSYVFDTFEEGEMLIIKMGAPLKPKGKGGIHIGKGMGKGKYKKQDKSSTPAPKNINIPYSKEMLVNLEACEFYGKLVPISKEATDAVAGILSPVLNMPKGDIKKVANKK